MTSRRSAGETVRVARAIRPKRARACTGSRERASTQPYLSMVSSPIRAAISVPGGASWAASSSPTLTPEVSWAPTTDPAEVPTTRSAPLRSVPCCASPASTPSSQATPVTPPLPSTSALPVMSPVLSHIPHISHGRHISAGSGRARRDAAAYVLYWGGGAGAVLAARRGSWRGPAAGHVRHAPARKSTRLNSSHTEIYTLSLHDALPI